MVKRNIHEMKEVLDAAKADFEIIHHDKPILTVKDAENIFDISKSAPVLVIKADAKYFALIKSMEQKKINFAHVKSVLSTDSAALADKQEVFELTGYSIGDIPLICLPIIYVMDQRLLEKDFVYGGIGDAHYTLKITPSDLVNINNITIFV